MFFYKNIDTQERLAMLLILFWFDALECFQHIFKYYCLINLFILSYI